MSFNAVRMMKSLAHRRFDNQSHVRALLGCRYVRAMEYFDNFIISSAALMEPVIAEFSAVIFGVGQWPGIWGWLGNILVASGTFVVLYNDGKVKTSNDDKSQSQ